MTGNNKSRMLDFTPMGRKRVRAVTAAVCDYFNVDDAYLTDASRDGARSFARQVWMTVLYHDVALTFTDVGELIGRDHSTIMHGVAHIGALAARGDEQTLNAFAHIRALYPQAGRLSPGAVVRGGSQRTRLDGEPIDRAAYHRAPLVLVPDTAVPLPRPVKAGAAREEMEARYFQIQAREKARREVLIWAS